jgi:hypothetical protein
MNLMSDENSNPLSMREKLKHEGKKFLIIFLYLAPCLTVLLLFKQAVLADYQINYFRHGYAVVEALILSKMIVLGQAWRVGEKYQEAPLIYPTLYKALMFTLLIIVFSIIEHLLDGFLHHERLAETIQKMLADGWHEMLANALIMFFIFIPFFAFQEVGRLTGEDKLFELFFYKRSSMRIH